MNVAGGTGTIGKTGVETMPDEFDATLALNMGGCFNMMRAVLPAMIEQHYGKIVNVGGTFGMRGRAGRLAYSASKWGLRGITKSFALEAGPYNINVNCVAPGMVDGPRFREKVCADMARKASHEHDLRDIALRLLFCHRRSWGRRRIHDRAGHRKGMEAVLEGGAPRDAARADRRRSRHGVHRPSSHSVHPRGAARRAECVVLLDQEPRGRALACVAIGGAAQTGVGIDHIRVFVIAGHSALKTRVNAGNPSSLRKEMDHPNSVYPSSGVLVRKSDEI